MVRFNELRITSDGKKLVIDTEVMELPYYKGLTISEIKIDTYDTFVSDAKPSENTVYTKSDIDSKSLRLTLDIKTDLPKVDVDKLFLFVWVKVKGVPGVDVPCNMDKEYTLGVTFDTCPMYTTFMQKVKEVQQDCNIPYEFIDFYLKYKALQVSIDSGHFTEAVKIYKKYFTKTSIRSLINNCNCNGRNTV